MIKYACDVCESVEGVNRISFNTNKETVQDLDVCNMHIRMLAMYLLNRLTRNEQWEEEIAAYKYLQTIAKNNQEHKNK